MNPALEPIARLLAIFIVLIVLFLIFREIITWYWKLTKIANQQVDQIDVLNQMCRLLIDIRTSLEEVSTYRVAGVAEEVNDDS